MNLKPARHRDLIGRSTNKSIRRPGVLKRIGSILVGGCTIASTLFPDYVGPLRNIVLTFWWVTLPVGIGIILWGYWYWLTEWWSKKRWRIYAMIGAAVIVFQVWWGWHRIQEFLDPSAFHRDKWMSEENTEKHIVKVLMEVKDANVFEQRVRTLIVDAISSEFGARYRCNSDTNWYRLVWDSTGEALFDLRDYDGTEKLSHGTSCQIQYLTEHVHKWPWVRRNAEMAFTRPNPEK